MLALSHIQVGLQVLKYWKGFYLHGCQSRGSPFHGLDVPKAACWAHSRTSWLPPLPPFQEPTDLLTSSKLAQQWEGRGTQRSRLIPQSEGWSIPSCLEKCGLSQRCFYLLQKKPGQLGQSSEWVGQEPEHEAEFCSHLEKVWVLQNEAAVLYCLTAGMGQSALLPMKSWPKGAFYAGSMLLLQGCAYCTHGTEDILPYCAEDRHSVSFKDRLALSSPSYLLGFTYQGNTNTPLERTRWGEGGRVALFLCRPLRLPDPSGRSSQTGFPQRTPVDYWAHAASLSNSFRHICIRKPPRDASEEAYP